MTCNLSTTWRGVTDSSMQVVFRRGYDVVEFAQQGATSVVGMELVPEAVSLDSLQTSALV